MWATYRPWTLLCLHFLKNWERDKCSTGRDDNKKSHRSIPRTERLSGSAAEISGLSLQFVNTFSCFSSPSSCSLLLNLPVTCWRDVSALSDHPASLRLYRGSILRCYHPPPLCLCNIYTDWWGATRPHSTGCVKEALISVSGGLNRSSSSAGESSVEAPGFLPATSPTIWASCAERVHFRCVQISNWFTTHPLAWSI